MLQALTTKQQKVLRYYQKYLQQHDQAPTYQQAAEDLGISPSVVHNHVKNMEKLGYMVKQADSSIQLNSHIVALPLLGTVACGHPIDVYEHVEETIEVPKSMIQSGESHYILRAKGKSMIQAGILPWDLLIIRKQAQVNDGEIAVVVTQNEEATLKRVFRKPASILLKAENDEFPNIIMTDPGVQIRGKLVSVIRQY